MKNKSYRTGSIGKNTVGKSRLLMLSLSLMLFLSLMLSLVACKQEEEVNTGPTPPPGAEGYAQYGDPFDQVPATADIAMYEVNLSVFSPEGDLQGVQARLDEIKDLGINVVWLMPIHPTGERRGIGSPYAIRNFRQVKPEYGSLRDLRLLVEEAHKREMAVILDLVANHTAWDHPWIEENPDWYTQDAAGNIVSPPGMGWDDVADLNYDNPSLRREMIDVMKFWVLEANVDGYRSDYADGVPTDFWRQAIDSLRAIPDRDIIMFAEAIDKELYQAGFDLTFGWRFYHRLRDVFNEGASAAVLTAAHEADYQNVPEGSHILRWIDNHDDNAWHDIPLNVFNGSQGKMAAFVLTAYMGGVPLIYNGQEIAYPRRLPFFEGHSLSIDWSLNPEIRAEYKSLMAFRNGSQAVKRGRLETYHSEDVMAFKRVAGEEEVLVIVNVRNRALNYELPSSLAHSSWEHALRNETLTFSDVVSLAPYSYLILKN